MTWDPILKTGVRDPVLTDYEAASSAFSWAEARRSLVEGDVPQPDDVVAAALRAVS